MKRTLLFIGTNLAIMLVLGIVTTLTGANRYFTGAGLDLGKLLFFALIMGFGGAFISLWMSKFIAKWSTGARVIESPANSTEFWLVDTVRRFAAKAGLTMPEVAIYEGEPNAFATGASRNNSLVAVSTGLLQSMTREEAEAVIAHEVAHIANGDMVTLTLIQGVVNTFVIFISRVVGYFIDRVVLKNREEAGVGYMVTVVICDIAFGILASIIVMYFSRQREFRADAGAADLMGSPQPMMAALNRLGDLKSGELPKSVATAGISGRPSWTALFSSHPPLEQRIAVLARLSTASNH